MAIDLFDKLTASTTPAKTPSDDLYARLAGLPAPVGEPTAASELAGPVSADALYADLVRPAPRTAWDRVVGPVLKGTWETTRGLITTKLGTAVGTGLAAVSTPLYYALEGGEKSLGEAFTELRAGVQPDVVRANLNRTLAAHPGYEPEDVESVGEYFTSLHGAEALYGRLAQQAPGLATMTYQTVVGGPLAAFTTGYSLSADSSYEEALASGATEDQAERTSHINGVIGGALDAFGMAKFLNFGHGAADVVRRSIAGEISRRAAFGAISRDALAQVAVQGFINFAQGTLNELVPMGVYSKPIEPGFVDRRLRELVDTTVLTAVFAGGGAAVGRVLPADVATPEHTALTSDIVVAPRDRLYRELRNVSNVDEQTARDYVDIFDYNARTWSEFTGRPADEFYEGLGRGIEFERATAPDETPPEGTTLRSAEKPLDPAEIRRKADEFVASGRLVLEATGPDGKIAELEGMLDSVTTRANELTPGEPDHNTLIPAITSLQEKIFDIERAQRAKLDEMRRRRGGTADEGTTLEQGPAEREGRPDLRDLSDDELAERMRQVTSDEPMPSAGQADALETARAESAIRRRVEAFERRRSASRALEDARIDAQRLRIRFGDTEIPPGLSRVEALDLLDKLVQRDGPKPVTLVNQAGRSYDAGTYDASPMSHTKLARTLLRADDLVVTQLFQGRGKGPPRGDITFTPDARVIVRTFEAADASTVLHELFHYFTWMMAPAEGKPNHAGIEQLNTFVKAKAGASPREWTTAQHERAATAWERYVREGLAPTRGLVGVFARAKQWLKGIYPKARALGATLTPDVRTAFDSFLAPDTTRAVAARTALAQSREAVDVAKKAGVDANVQTLLREQLAGAERELRDALESNRFPREELVLSGGPTKADVEAAIIAPYVAQAAPSERRIVRAVQSVWDGVYTTFGSHAQALARTAGGRATVEKLNSAWNYANSLRARVQDGFEQAYLGLSSADKRWARADPDNTGLPNIVRMIEQVGVDDARKVVAPTDALRRFAAFVAEAQYAYGSEAKLQGFLQRMQSGDVVPTRLPLGKTRFPRIPTQAFYEAMHNPGSPLYNAIVEMYIRRNPTMFPAGTPPQRVRFEIVRKLEQQYGKQSLRELGALESAREFKYADYAVRDGNGRWVDIFHTDPYTVMDRSLHLQALRLGFTKQFGQINLKPSVGQGGIAALAKILGVSPRFGVEKLRKRLVDSGKVTAEAAAPLDLATLRKLARAVGEPAGVTRNDLLAAIERVNPNALSTSQRKAVFEYARRVRGVDVDVPFFDLYDQVLRRAATPEPDVLATLRRDHVARGGSAEDFDNILRVFQGLPYKWLPRTTPWRVLRLASDVIGSAQTSLAVVPNLTQPLLVAPDVGLRRLARATQNALSDYAFTRSQGVALGAFRRAIYSFGFERGHLLEDTGRNIRQAVASVTGLRLVNEFNNVVSAEAYRLLVSDWASHGLSTADVAVARRLGMTDAEVVAAKRGVVADDVAARVIQNGVAGTQFTTAAPHVQARIQNIPIGRILFSYASFSTGMTRRAVDVISEVGGAVRAKSPVALGGAGRRLATYLAVGVGAGMTVQLFKQAMRGRLAPPPDDKRALDRALGALAETQLIGSAQRMIDPFTFDGGVVDKAVVGAFPQLKAVVDLVGSVLGGYGAKGDFPIGARVIDTLERHTPLVRNAALWWEKVAYPETQTYYDTRGVVRRWKAENGLAAHGGAVAPANPEYHATYMDVVHGDAELALEHAVEYYERRIAAGEDMDVARRRLRASLVARSPMFLSSDNAITFLSTSRSDVAGSVLAAHAAYMNVVNLVAAANMAERQSSHERTLRGLVPRIPQTPLATRRGRRDDGIPRGARAQR